MINFILNNIVSKISPLLGSNADESLLRLRSFPEMLLLSRRGFLVFKNLPSPKKSLQKLSEHRANTNNIPIKVVRNSHQSVEDRKFENLIFYVEKRADLTLISSR